MPKAKTAPPEPTLLDADPIVVAAVPAPADGASGVMSDDPPPGFEDAAGSPAGVEPPPAVIPGSQSSPPPSPHVQAVTRDAVAHRPAARYEQRIRVIEAYRFDGNVRTAPDWVDRNWIAIVDPVYGVGAEILKPGGAALRVPTSRGRDDVARVGDYLVKQEVMLAEGVPIEQLEVWPAHEFERIFIPLPPLDATIGLAGTESAA